MDERSAQETQHVELYVDAAGGRKTAGGIGIIAVVAARDTGNLDTTLERHAEVMSSIPAAPQLWSELLGIYTALRSRTTMLLAVQASLDQPVILFTDSQPALRAVQTGSCPIARRIAQEVTFTGGPRGIITLMFCSARGCTRMSRWMRRADELSREARAWIRRG